MSVKNNKKADRLCMKLSSTFNKVTLKGTTKGFISPEYFLIFFSNLHSPPWLRKSFKFLVLRLLEDTFLLMPLSKTLPRQKEITHFLRTEFSEKMTKIKLARVLVTTFDKFNHLCNLYIVGFCFVVP